MLQFMSSINTILTISGECVAFERLRIARRQQLVKHICAGCVTHVSQYQCVYYSTSMFIDWREMFVEEAQEIQSGDCFHCYCQCYSAYSRITESMFDARYVWKYSWKKRERETQRADDMRV